MEPSMSTSRAEPEPEAPSLTRVILFDAEPTSRARLRDALAPLGLPVVEATTPLEAIYALARASRETCVAFVGRRLLDTTPSEFLRFALEEFPGLTLITTSDAEGAADERVLHLDDDADPRALVDALARVGGLRPDMTALA